MNKRGFLCFYEGQGDQWEAISVDFDIAVAARSFEEAKAALKSAILTYIEDAEALEPKARDRLLNRRMPLHVQALWRLKILLHKLRPGRKGADGRFELPCPA